MNQPLLNGISFFSEAVAHHMYPDSARAIAILTSGGDSPGMNAALRSIVRMALYEKYRAFAIYEGYQGIV